MAEYESDELASNSDDDRKIRRAEARALSRKRKISTGRGYGNMPTATATSNSSLFETFRPFRSMLRLFRIRVHQCLSKSNLTILVL